MDVVALILGFGLLARLILNMRKQNRLLLEDVRALDRNVTVTRAHCAALLRRVRHQRDVYGDGLDEMQARTVELERELSAYRREEAGREAAAKERRARLN